MKRNYYYIVAGLQDLTLDIHKLSTGQLEFRDYLKAQVHPDDYSLVQNLFLPFDNKNLLNLLLKKEEVLNLKGNFTQLQLEENIKEPNGELPAYMDQFILSIKNDDPVIPNMSPENQLTHLFYEHAVSLKDDFITNWFTFNRNLNNLTTALICRKYDVSYEYQVLGTDDISEAIRKSHARDFGLAFEITYIEELISIMNNDNVQEREKAIDKIKWKHLDDVTFFEYFTMARILAFIIKLDIVERWLTIDKEHGSRLFDELLQELKSSYELPETFTVK